VQLGATAEGTVQIVAQRSSLKPYPIEISEGRAHVTALANALAEVAAKTRAAIDECGQIGDQTSAGPPRWIAREQTWTHAGEP
jgi:starvation-inducible DNA-binding protein